MFSKYRITSNGSRFSPQERWFLFFWKQFDGSDEVGREYYECFDTLKEAEDYIQRIKRQRDEIPWVEVKKL